MGEFWNPRPLADDEALRALEPLRCTVWAAAIFAEPDVATEHVDGPSIFAEVHWQKLDSGEDVILQRRQVGNNYRYTLQVFRELSTERSENYSFSTAAHGGIAFDADGVKKGVWSIENEMVITKHLRSSGINPLTYLEQLEKETADRKIHDEIYWQLAGRIALQDPASADMIEQLRRLRNGKRRSKVHMQLSQHLQDAEGLALPAGRIKLAIDQALGKA